MAEKIKKFKPGTRYSLKVMGLWIAVFAAIGVATLLLTRAATPGIAVTVDSSLPNPTKVKAYADDRVATITWDPVSNASSKNIIGYYVSWGSGSTYTNARQTEYNSIQIQPLTNGTLYNVKVQSVQGSEVNVSTPGAHDSETATEYRANGKVSTGVTATVTPSGARVDQLRQQMTGFFDDFNTAAGAFDELKWNTAGSSCVPPSSAGAFINNQFHAHSQARSSFGDYTYCDRGQVVNRPRAVFDITGRTEANPGVITFDFDGVTNGRDAWYIDLVPVSARKTGAPLDITSHASIFDDDTADPVLFRIIQQPGSIDFSTYDSNKNPADVQMTYVNCPDFRGILSFDSTWCGGNMGTQDPNFSPLPEAPIDSEHPGAIPNVRRHWRVEVSPTKIKLFVDGYRMLEAQMPSALANVRQWYVHNNIFTYNTGKDTPANPTTSLLHWDNFGFNGPAPTTVVHNYMEGGPNGTQPYFGRGIAADDLSVGKRATKINVPDSIGNPVKARLMFTFGAFGYQNYKWTSNDHVIINGKRYNYPDPALNSIQPPVTGPYLADGYTPFADSIAINPADLKQGMNDVQLNLVNDNDNAAIMNVHLELEYTKGTEPSYTQPTAVFGASKFLQQIQPVMTAHDNYLFVEQDFGLPSGTLDSTTPIPPTTGGDTTKPTVTLTEPANGSSVNAGASFTATAGASDDIGVTKVEFYLGSTLKATDTSSPYTQIISTSGLNPGSYNITAVAYDAAGNTATSNSRTITIPAPPDTTPPSVGITAPASGASVSGASVSLQANAGDTSGIDKVEFYIDTTLISTDTSEPYSATLDSTKYTNGNHNLTAKAYDTPGNAATSQAVAVTINNALVDTTPPSVGISAPIAGATISGSMAFIQATASDGGGAINRVEFYIDGSLLGTDTTAPYTFSLNTTLYPNGSHSLTAKAYDTSNNTRTSAAISVTVNNTLADTTPPSVVITTPLVGATINGSYTISVNASDTNGINKVEISVDSTLKATDTNAPYTYILDTTSLSKGSHTITANAYDTAGNSQSATAAVIVDNTPPAPVPKTGDFDGNGHVDLRDLITLLGNYGKAVTANKDGDCNGDGTVDLKDLIALLGAYGS